MLKRIFLPLVAVVMSVVMGVAANAASYQTSHYAPHGAYPDPTVASWLIQSNTHDSGNGIELDNFRVQCGSGCGKVNSNGLYQFRIVVQGSGGATLWTSGKMAVAVGQVKVIPVNVQMGKGALWSASGITGVAGAASNQDWGDCWKVHPDGDLGVYHPSCVYTINQ